jgi:hypothetical protein
MDDDDMSENDQKKLALSEIVLIILAVIGLGVVVWLGWFRF